MDKFNFTPYGRLSLADSKGLAFKCENRDLFEVGYDVKLTGPGVVKRVGEETLWHLFFGGAPKYLDAEEIKDRANTSLDMILKNQRRIMETLAVALEEYVEDKESINNDEARKERKRIMEACLYHPKGFGLAEHLLRPEVGRKLVAGLSISNRLTENNRYRVLVSKTPIAEIYCLPPKE